MYSELYSNIKKSRIKSLDGNILKVGDVRFNSPVSMRNEWSTIRIQHKVTGSMLNKKLAVVFLLLKKPMVDILMKLQINGCISNIVPLLSN